MKTAAWLIACLCAAGCVRPSSSGDRSTQIPHSDIKRQSIGNCWAYGFIGLIESHEMAAGVVSDFSNYSESYISYRHFEDQLLRNHTTELATGGDWRDAVSIVRDHGLLREGDFITDEADESMSMRQQAALEYLEKSLASGKLLNDRSPATVTAELETAFRVRESDWKDKVISATNITVRSRDGLNVDLLTLLSGWTARNWSSHTYPRGGSSEPVLFNPSPWDLPANHQNLLRSVKTALNSGHSVVLSWLVEFNATDGGAFTLDPLTGPDYKLHNGLHMTPIADYTAAGFDPDTGVEFYVGEGQATPNEQRLAAEHGWIHHIVIKNSWGDGFERADRSFYLHGGHAGYHRLDSDYLNSWLWLGDQDSKTARLATLEYILPRDL